MLDLEQTHTAFPILTYFPGSDSEQSWVATVGAVLDASALVVAASDIDIGRGLCRRAEGPADRTRLRPPADRPDCHRRLHPVAPTDAAPRPVVPCGPAPSADEHQPGRVRHRPRGPVGDPRRPGGPRGGGVAPVRLDPIRLRPSAAGTGGGHPGLTAPWTTDRPAAVGSPRFIRRRPLPVDWSDIRLQVAEAA